MKQLSTQIIIDADRETVWNVLTDIRNYSRWNTFILKMDGRVAAGDPLDVIIDLADGTRHRRRLKTLKLIHGVEWTWLGHFNDQPGVLDGEHTFILQDAGHNKTLLINKENFTGIYSHVPAIMSFTIEQITLASEKMNRALKEYVEEGKIKRAVPERIIDWRDWVYTPPLEAVLILFSFAAAWKTHEVWHLGLFADVLVFGAVLMGLTIALIRVLLKFFPPAEGRFTRTEHPETVYVWGLINFLMMTNLFLYYQSSLLPIPLRKFFSRLLGANIGKGLINIGGVVVDPYLVTIKEEAVIGVDALLLPHTFMLGALVRGRVTVGSRAVIGVRSILMPGVTIGEGAMVKAMSVVDVGTNIPPYEIWGGIPARKMGELKPPAADAPRPFSGWPYMVISPLVEAALLFSSGIIAWHWAHWLKFGLFGGFLLFYALLVGQTLLVLKVLRTAFPFKEGTFTFKDHPWVCYRWSLHGFLCVMNLFLHFQNGLVSPIIRGFFNRMLGTKIKGRRGFLPMCGLSMDPYTLEMDQGTVICYDGLMLGHVLTPEGLILSRAKVGPNALIDLRALIMPGATIAEAARVGPLSLVTTGTEIKAGEIWSGVPARKVGEIKDGDLANVPTLNYEMSFGEMLRFAWPRALIYAAAALGTVVLAPMWRGDGFALVMVFHFFDVAVTLSALKILRSLFKFSPGTYPLKQWPDVIFQWGMYDALLVSHVQAYYVNALMPPHLLTVFLKLLGLKTNNDFFLVGGMVMEPHLVKIGKNALVSYGAMISPIQINEGALVMGEVNIGDFAAIGQRCVVLPNVTIGEGAIVEPMSLVASDTVIPPYEIWGGIPAKKVGELMQAQGVG